jgi:hypothetical protein
MLRIEKRYDGCATRVILTGRLQTDGIACIRSTLDDGCTRKILDLRDVGLVDLGVVHFLMSCEREGVELAECPPYIREWMIRERAEESEAVTVPNAS